jgi:hypothetical protein
LCAIASTEVDLALDLDACGFERLRVDFRQHELLGEVLRADANRLRRRRARREGQHRNRQPP